MVDCAWSSYPANGGLTLKAKKYISHKVRINLSGHRPLRRLNLLGNIQERTDAIKAKRCAAERRLVYINVVRQEWRSILADMDYLRCRKCGYDKCQDAIEYHHKDPKTKTMLISQQLRRKPRDEVIEELRQCVPLCANCHREHHAKI